MRDELRKLEFILYIQSQFNDRKQLVLADLLEQINNRQINNAEINTELSRLCDLEMKFFNIMRDCNVIPENKDWYRIAGILAGEFEF